MFGSRSSHRELEYIFSFFLDKSSSARNTPFCYYSTLTVLLNLSALVVVIAVAWARREVARDQSVAILVPKLVGGAVLLAFCVAVALVAIESLGCNRKSDVILELLYRAVVFLVERM